jgi:hypothetical protein
MQKPKKINYYSAGLISILLLPLLSILYLKNNDAFTEYGAIKLAVWNGENFEPEITHFLNSKKFTVVNLTGSLFRQSKIKNCSKKNQGINTLQRFQRGYQEDL